jgi:hypothetical protein
MLTSLLCTAYDALSCVPIALDAHIPQLLHNSDAN